MLHNIGDKWFDFCEKHKWADWIDNNILHYIYYKPSYILSDIRYWFRCNFNKYHWRLLKTAFNTYPWDYEGMIRLEYAHIDKQLYWFNHQTNHDTELREKKISVLKLAKSLLGVLLTGGDNLWTSEGDFEMCDIGNNLWELKEGTYKHYYIGPYINTKNALRFVDKKTLDVIEKNGLYEELYVEKCRILYLNLIKQYWYILGE